jgi:hypothetical protein
MVVEGNNGPDDVVVEARTVGGVLDQTLMVVVVVITTKYGKEKSLREDVEG